MSGTSGDYFWAENRSRTCNLLITNQLLCQLSYLGIDRRILTKTKVTGISYVGRISFYPLLLTYLMYPHHPSVATPISPMELLCPSWVFKRSAISLYLRRDSNSHSRRNLILSQAGLPIPPLRLSCDDGGTRTHDTRIISQAILLLVSIFCKHCRVRRSTAELHRHR